MPLSATSIVFPIEQLLIRATVPVEAPETVGSNCTASEADWPGFKVIGKLMPGMLNPEPVTEPALMMTAAVPVEVIVTDCVEGVFRLTLPKATVLDPKVRVGVVAFSVIAQVFEIPPDMAVRVTAWLVLTAVAVAVNAALEAPAAMVTEAGTVTALLLLAMVTVVAAVAGELSVTVHASVPAPVNDPLLQETALSVAGADPVPLRLMAAAAALLLMVTVPLAAPAVVGSKLTLSVAVWLGFSVIGKLMPESPKPVPATAAPLMVSAAVPDEVSVTVFVIAVFSRSVPNATLLELSVNAGLVAFSVSEQVFETPPEVAVSVTA